MPQYIIEIIRENVMIADFDGPPLGPIDITTRSRPFQTLAAAETLAAVMRKNMKVKTRIVCE